MSGINPGPTARMSYSAVCQATPATKTCRRGPRLGEYLRVPSGRRFPHRASSQASGMALLIAQIRLEADTLMVLKRGAI